MDPLLILFGLAVGALVGGTGVGGGSIMTPALILIFGVSPTVAVGTDIAYGAVTKTVGGWRHARMGTVDVRLCAWLAAGSIPGSIAGVWLLELLTAGGEGDARALLLPIGIAALATGLIVLRRAVSRGTPANQRQSAARTRRTAVLAVTVGLLGGIVIGLTSVGSGALLAVFLVVLFRLAPRRVVGTDVAHAAVLLWAASFAHLVGGNVDLLLALNILLGSVPGVWVGTMLAARVPERGLQLALAGVLGAAGLSMVSEAGAEIPPAVVIGAPLLVAMAAAGYRLHLRRSPARATQ